MYECAQQRVDKLIASPGESIQVRVQLACVRVCTCFEAGRTGDLMNQNGRYAGGYGLLLASRQITRFGAVFHTNAAAGVAGVAASVRWRYGHHPAAPRARRSSGTSQDHKFLPHVHGVALFECLSGGRCPASSRRPREDASVRGPRR